MAAVATMPAASNTDSKINSSPVSNKKKNLEDSKRSLKMSPKQLSKEAPNRTNNVNNNNSNNPSISIDSGSNQNSANPDEKRDSLPPPPPPAATEEGPGDYFSGNHGSKYGDEPNPFEQSFSVNDGLTPGGGKAILPPASQIASPSPNPGTSFWGIHSLRSGPLSPAMLAGPSGNSFDPSSTFKTGLTPNESGIRTGLTPGGSGTMFPSPNTTAIFGGFSSGTTPGTMEFHKTALAAAQQHANRGKLQAAQTTAQPQLKQDPDAMDVVPTVPPKNATAIKNSHGRQASDPFGNDANAAASGLFMLAQQGIPTTQAGAQQGIGLGIDPARGAVPQTNGKPGPGRPQQIQLQHQQASLNNHHGGEEDNQSDSTDGNDHTMTKPGKNGAQAAKGGAGVRRKADEANVGKVPAGKKHKGGPPSMEDSEDEDEDDDGMNGGKDPKKMTDEEKRKNFLERNRVAALKCRQRKKQWLANLQAKVEYYGAENDALTSQVTNLREEIVALKTLLLAHKDCPISRATGTQGIGGLEAIAGLGQHEYTAVPHPYAGVPVSMAPPGPRRFS